MPLETVSGSTVVRGLAGLPLPPSLNPQPQPPSVCLDSYPLTVLFREEFHSQEKIQHNLRAPGILFCFVFGEEIFFLAVYVSLVL